MRPKLGCVPPCSLLFQSTHPHGVRQQSWAVYRLALYVSIHAPTRGATKTRQFYGRMELVSIHAPTRGATSSTSSSLPGNGVSIHAPTRGATLTNLAFVIISKGFNPRTHTGCDSLDCFFICSGWVSIHAPTRGATYQGVCLAEAKSVSIHAPTRGATPSAKAASAEPLVSIHAPTRGATQSV